MNPHLAIEIKQLRIAYELRGRADGPTVLLLHGWPDDARAWDAVSERLVEAGFRTIAPYLRGFGPTRFREASTPRTGQFTAMACDFVQLLDALGIETATVVGHDWGARIGYVMAALWPTRVERLVTLAVAYETGITPGSQLNYRQQQAFWYQWFFASERGREALQDNRRALCRHLWRTWSPTWRFTEAEFSATAASWDNPDWVDITLHSYRVRWGNAAADPRCAPWEAKMRDRPAITVPTVELHGELDGANLVDALKDDAGSFTAAYRREVLPGVGHFIHRERPEAVADVLLRNARDGLGSVEPRA